MLAKAKLKSAASQAQVLVEVEAVQRYAITDPRWQAFYESIVTLHRAWVDPANRPG